MPRPANLPANVKWNKYCPANQNYSEISPELYLDKHETAFCDYISCHIKVSFRSVSTYDDDVDDDYCDDD